MPLPVAILAGGLSTRLYPATEKNPKALLDVAGKPFIAYQLENLRQNGICEVVICAGYLGQLIADFVGDGSKFGLSVRFSYDGAKPLGTGGAIKRALPLLGDAFWVMYGDAYLNVVFRQVADFFLSRDKLGLMTVYKNNNQWDTSNVVFFK
jgi:NDP-sugar pyrophosphorylase family protein